jgi:hypothetical protein
VLYGDGWLRPRHGCFTPGNDPVPGRVWTGAENFASTGIRFLDRPARSTCIAAIPTTLSPP